MAEMMAEAENARVAWEWAVDQGDLVRIGQVMEGLCRFYERRGRYQEGDAACQLVAEKLRRMESELSGEGLRALARACGWQGLFNQFMGRIDIIPQLLQQSLSLLEDSRLAGEDTRPERAFLLHQLGQTTRQSAREEARQCWEESLALYRALGDQWAEASLLSDLAYLYSDVGERDRAGRVWAESLDLHRSLGDQRGIAQVLVTLALHAQPEEAERLAREAIELHRDAGDRLGIAVGLHGLASSYLGQGRFTEAHGLLEDVLAETEDLGSRGYAASARVTLAGVEKHLGLYEEARALYAVSLEHYREMDDRRGIGLCLFCLSQALIGQESYDEAQQFLRESIPILREVQQPDLLAEALTGLGHAERGLGRPARARQCLAEGLRIAYEIGRFLLCLDSVQLMTLLLVDRGEVERAVELYALVARHPWAPNSRWFEDVVGKHIIAAAATLPSGVLAAARERGQARDLETAIAELLAELGAAPDRRQSGAFPHT